METPKVRLPLSLRELFALITLACVLAAGICWPGWSSAFGGYSADAVAGTERWILGLAVGGNLLGNLAARSLSRRGWEWGLALGSVGAMAAIGLAFYRVFQEYGNGSAVSPSDYIISQGLWGVAILGSLASLLLVLMTQLAFAGLNWITSGQPSGAIAQLRKHPRRGTSFLGVLIAFAVCGFNLESILWPNAVPISTAVEFKEGGQPLLISGGYVDLSLSRDGQLLAVSFEVVRPDDAVRSVGRTWIYDISETPRKIEPRGLIPHYPHQVAFDIESNRLVVLDRDGEQPAVVLDVEGQKSYSSLQLNDGNDWLFIERILWLPQGQLCLQDGGERPPIVDVETGRSVTPEAVEEPISETIRYEPRLDHQYHFVHGKVPMVGRPDYRALRIYSLKTQKLHANFECDIPAGDPATASPDGEFVMYSTSTGPVLFQVRQRKSRPLSGSNWMFTSRGHVMHSNVDLSLFGSHVHRWPDFVPFVRHSYAWWNRPRICWLDPHSGRTIAYTAPLPAEIWNISISYDGSTVAAATWTGVYVFEVPSELR